MCWPSTSDAVNETDNDHNDDDREAAGGWDKGWGRGRSKHRHRGRDRQAVELFAAACVELCLVAKFLWPLIVLPRPKLLLDLCTMR